MAIKFICSCGKHLRARDEMAARRSVCPRCGAPVGIPSLQPNQRGADARPLAPHERRARQRVLPPARPDDTPLPPSEPRIDPLPHVPAEAPADGPKPRRRPLDLGLVRLITGRGRYLQGRRGWRWRLETRWYECLEYPLRALPLVVGLGVAGALLVGSGVLALSQSDLPAEPAARAFLGLVWLLPAVAVLAYAFGFLDCVLASAIAGETSRICWPGANVGLALGSLVTWLVCFLAGPAFAAYAGFRYWLYSGDPGILDRIILAELLFLMAGYWLLAVVSVGQRDRLRDANPIRVAALVERLGYRAVIAALAAPALAWFHGRWLVLGLEQLHLDPGLGWLLLLLCGVSAMYWATFLFRLFGIWCHHERARNARPGRSDLPPSIW